MHPLLTLSPELSLDLKQRGSLALFFLRHPLPWPYYDTIDFQALGACWWYGGRRLGFRTAGRYLWHGSARLLKLHHDGGGSTHLWTRRHARGIARRILRLYHCVPNWLVHTLLPPPVLMCTSLDVCMQSCKIKIGYRPRTPYSDLLTGLHQGDHHCCTPAHVHSCTQSVWLNAL